MRTLPSHKRNVLSANARRWQSEFAQEPWTINPLDRMTATQFEAWLVSRFGADYLQPVAYRWHDGRLIPARSS